MRGGQIAIQRQRPLAFGDALCCAVRKYLDDGQYQVRQCMVRRDRQNLDQNRFGFRQTRDAVVSKKVSSQSSVNLCHTDERLRVVRIERQGPFEKVARLRHVFGC